MKKLFIIFAVLCLAAPAMAADWNFYGSARFATFWVSDDFDQIIDGHDGDDDLQWAQQGNSRVGANVKFNDQIGGRFEYGDNGTLVSKRIVYGTYKFGAGELLIGQTYTPSAMFYSNSVFDSDGDLLGVGEFYDGRSQMIQLKMGGFKVALIRPTVNGVGDVATDVTIPKVEVAYGFKTDMFFADVFAGYQTFELDGGALDPSFDVDSYVAGIGGGVNLGPVYIKASAHIGQNLGNMGGYNPLAFDTAAEFVVNPVTGADEIRDTDAFGALAVVGFNVSEKLVIEGGVGYQNYEKDIAGTQDETGMQYYVNATINIAPGFFIVPEVGHITADYDVGVAVVDPEPTRTYVGAKWQINF
jgi:hypothetical protein